MNIPTLSQQYTMTITQALYKLFTYFILCDHSQTNIYRGNVVSLKYLLQQYKDDELLDVIDTQLSKMYSRYFGKESEVGTLNEINVTSSFQKHDQLLYLKIDIYVVISGERFSLNRSIDTTNIYSVLDSKYNDELNKNSNVTIFNVN